MSENIFDKFMSKCISEKYMCLNVYPKNRTSKSISENDMSKSTSISGIYMSNS